MINDQGIAKFRQLAARIFGCVGCVYPVMEVDFNFSPASVTVLGKAVDQWPARNDRQEQGSDAPRHAGLFE